MILCRRLPSGRPARCDDRDVRIVLLGASGNLGREVARLLSPSLAPDDVLVLAGRNVERLDAAAASTSGPARVATECVDAGDEDAVRRLVTGAGLVVVTASVPDRLPTLARIVAEAGADWFDTLLSTRTKVARLRALGPAYATGGGCAVTDGGFHPGLPAAMVRWAGRHLDRVESADVCAGMRLDWRTETLSDSTVEEMLTEFGDFDMTTFVDGGWRKLPWSRSPAVDFGPPIGRKTCVPMYLGEMESLPEEFPSLRRTGFYVGGFSPAFDYLALPVIMAMTKARALRGATVRFTRWAMGHLVSSPPPYRLVLELRAIGSLDGSPAVATVRVSGDDGYLMTAAPVVACARRLVDGTARRPGLTFQADLLDPDELFAELSGLGIEVELSVSAG